VSNRLRTRNHFWGGGTGGVIPLISGGSLASGLTFTRASSATYTDGAGVIQTVGNDVPRYPNGLGRLLIEGARTNASPYSSDPTNAAWVGTNASNVASGFPPPAGLGPVAKFTPSGANTTSHYTFLPAATVTAAAWTYSLIVSAAEYSLVQLLWGSANLTNYANFDLTNGTVTAGTYTDAKIVPLGSGWYRISITSTLAVGQGGALARAVTTNMGRVATSYAGNSSDGFYFLEGQQEAGAFASSIIPTPGASTATRARDVLSGTLAALQLPGNGFTITGRCLIPQNAPTAINQLMAVVRGANDQNAYYIYNSAASSTIRVTRNTAGVASGTPSSGSMTPGVAFGWAMAVDLVSGAASICMEGGVVQSVTGGPTSAAITTLQLGGTATAGGELFGAISASALPYVAPNASLPALAAAA